MITLENVFKEYQLGETIVKALDHVQLMIPDGAFFAVMGKSGSGKTTLLHIIGGLDRPDSGKVLIDQANIVSMPEKKLSVFRRKKIGFVFQFFNLIPEITAKENILFPALLDKTEIDREYYGELIRLLQLEDRQNHLPSQLSGGQQQRVAIARALILKPKVLLLDEPTGNLDEASSVSTTRMLLSLQKRFAQTVVMVTHDPDLSSCADRIVQIQDGVVTYEH